MSSDKKASAITVSVFVLALIAIFGLMQLTLTEPTDVNIKEEREKMTEQLLTTRAELTKNAVTNMLIISAKKAAYDSAKNSIDKPDKYFLVFGQPVIPDLEQGKESINTRTTQHCNEYLATLDSLEEYEETGNINEVKIWITEPSLARGSEDEGFKISALGDPTILTADQFTEEVDLRLTTNIDNTRYWYLYRKIRGWAEGMELAKLTCNKMPIVKGQTSDACNDIYAPFLDDSVVDEIMEIAIDELQLSFDGEVICDYEILCRDVQSFIEWLSPCEGLCSGWDCDWEESRVTCATGPCKADNCPNPPGYNDLCNNPVKLNYTYTWIYPEGIRIIPSVITNGKYQMITFAEKLKVKFIAKVACTDQKFTYLPDDPYTNLELEFLVHVYVLRQELPEEKECPCVIQGGGGGGGITKDLPEPSLPYYYGPGNGLGTGPGNGLGTGPGPPPPIQPPSPPSTPQPGGTGTKPPTSPG